jgi:protein TonB
VRQTRGTNMRTGLITLVLAPLAFLATNCTDQTPSGPLPSCSLRIVEWDAVDSSFEFLGMDPPIYPDSAREQGHQGKVVIRVVVDHDGSLCEVGVGSSSGYPELDDSALKAAGTARFSAARQGGFPVRVEVSIPLEFSLRPSA